ncbi:MAG: tRNA (adenosine(37)-N6)-dimethylallyltransferase MiaA [Clostridia bacterium]
MILGLVGPTAIGKSALALQLAKELNTNIISADSMQIFKEFNIGTAKPSNEEMSRIKHYMINIVDPCDSFNSNNYSQQVDKIITLENDKGQIPFMVGGTGFYFDSTLYEMDFENSVDYDLRKELNNYLILNGALELHNLLMKYDIESAMKIHPNNTKKVIRAIEIYKTTGLKKSDGNLNNKKLKYENIIFELTINREVLYKNIEKRVDKMIDNGLFDEVFNLMKYVPIDAQSMQGIGYKESVNYLKGNCTKEQTITSIKQNTRNYAKRQITYFKRLNTIKLDADLSANENINIINSIIKRYI